MKQLLGLFLLLVTSVVNASDWIPVSNSIETTTYVHTKTIKKNGNKITAWVIDDFKQPRIVEGSAMSSLKSHTLFDCVGRTRQMLSIAAYSGNMAKGTVLGYDITPSELVPISPESVDEIIMEHLCK